MILDVKIVTQVSFHLGSRDKTSTFLFNVTVLLFYNYLVLISVGQLIFLLFPFGVFLFGPFCIRALM